MELRVRKKIERVETLYLENGQTVPTPYKVAIAAIVIAAVVVIGYCVTNVCTTGVINMNAKASRMSQRRR